MKKKISVLVVASAILISGVVASTSSANAAVCTTAICGPNPDGVVDMRRPLNSTPPVTVCDIMNNPVVDVVVQIVGGILKVHWVVSLVPTVVCRLV
jgi:hypothetical protein